MCISIMHACIRRLYFNQSVLNIVKHVAGSGIPLVQNI